MALSVARKGLSRRGTASRCRRIWCRHSLGWGDRSGPRAVRAVSKRIRLMDHRLVLAPARPAARAFAVAVATTMLTALIGSGAFAQAPPTPPAPPAPQAAPKPVAKAQQKA